jgi:hypothetical protein
VIVNLERNLRETGAVKKAVANHKPGVGDQALDDESIPQLSIRHHQWSAASQNSARRHGGSPNIGEGGGTCRLALREFHPIMGALAPAVASRGVVFHLLMLLEACHCFRAGSSPRLLAGRVHLTGTQEPQQVSQ